MPTVILLGRYFELRTRRRTGAAVTALLSLGAKDVALLDQPYAKDDKQSVSQFIGGASIIQFAQVEIG